MNPIIQANERFVYLRDLPSAVALHDFIRQLDHQYGVDSNDGDNTFGKVDLDKPIVQHGVSNTLYFAGISTYRPDNMRLPTHQAIPESHAAIVIDAHGNVQLVERESRVNARKVPITIDPVHIDQLKQLRSAFKREVEANAPKMPVRNDEATDTEKDQALLRQQFAPHKGYTFKEVFKVPDQNGKERAFEVEYYRLGSNYDPHFSTTYGGWQRQEDMDHESLAYRFYRKWDTLHLSVMTLDEYAEMRNDLDQLKQYYQ